MINDLFRSRVTELEASEAAAIDAARRAEISVQEIKRRECVLIEMLEEMRSREAVMCERIERLEAAGREKQEIKNENEFGLSQEKLGVKRGSEVSSTSSMPPPILQNGIGDRKQSVTPTAGNALGNGLQLPHLRETLQSRSLTPELIDGDNLPLSQREMQTETPQMSSSAASTTTGPILATTGVNATTLPSLALLPRPSFSHHDSHSSSHSHIEPLEPTPIGPLLDPLDHGHGHAHAHIGFAASRHVQGAGQILHEPMVKKIKLAESIECFPPIRASSVPVPGQK